MEPLEGTRIVLRAYEPADAEAGLRWKNDPATTLWMGPRFRRPVTLDQARESVRKALAAPPDEALFFAIADKLTRRYLGGIDLTDLDPVDRRGVLSMVIADAADRGRGLGGEALGILLAYAFGPLRLHKVSLRVYEDNEPALKCYLRAGFRIEGRLRDHSLIGGVYCDLLPLGMLESEYRDGPFVTKNLHGIGGMEDR